MYVKVKLSRKMLEDVLKKDCRNYITVSVPYDSTDIVSKTKVKYALRERLRVIEIVNNDLSAEEVIYHFNKLAKEIGLGVHWKEDK